MQHNRSYGTLSSFTSKLLITFLQIAFGMGIDKPDGNHWPFPWICTDTYQRISALCDPP